MKKLRYIKFAALALLCGMAASCMDEDWDDPDTTTSPYGNNSLEETNVVTIEDLKSTYFGSSSEAYDTIHITEAVQIKGVVTANDIEGNIYNEICVEDETGGILICISQGGLCGYLPVGQEILVDLQDLYIGHYGSQPQIGTPYTNSSGRTFPSRMNRTLWQEKFKLIGDADPDSVEPMEFDTDMISDEDYITANCGRLMVVKGVTLAAANGTAVWASEDDADSGNGVSRTIKVDGKSNSSFVVRTSTYADFAADVIPTGTVNLTGVFNVYASNPSRYGYTWQILLRQGSDVEETD